VELVRTWARWISGALGASLLVPGAVMVVAAGIALGGGGIGGLGTLGQLVEGPREPLGAVAPAGADTLAADPAALIATTAEATGGEGTRGGTDDGGGTGGGENGGGTPGGGGGGENGEPDDGGDNTTPPGGGGETGTTPQPPADTDQPSALDELGDSTDPLTEQLPAPVGALSGDAIDQVVEIGEDVLGEPGTGQGLLGQLPR
jgi:hypothetical protein